MNAVSARVYTAQEIKSYLLSLYQNYVVHKKILIERADPGYYRTMKKLDSLDKCMKYAELFREWKVVNVARKILELEKDLQRILPKHTNPSYTRQSEVLTEMRHVSNTILSQLK